MTTAELLEKKEIKKGIKKGKMEAAGKMIKKGFTLNDVVEIIGLSKEELIKAGNIKQ